MIVTEHSRPAFGKTGEETTFSINIQEELKRHQVLKGLFPLNAYINEDSSDRWEQRSFPRDKHHIYISTSEASLSADPNQKFYITVSLLGNFWFAFKRQLRGQCLFNGVNSYQDILVANSSTLLEFENSRMIITNRKPASFDQTDVSLRGKPEKGEYAIKSPQGTFRHHHEKTVLIGSNPICDILIKGAPFAAMVVMSKGFLHLVNLGSETLSINDTMVKQKVSILKDRDHFAVGAYAMSVYLPTELADAFASSAPVGSLCMIPILPEGGEIEKLYLPYGGSLMFGRSKSCDCLVDIDGVSRKHAQIIVYDNHVMVLDCYSTNGTFVNNSKITKKRAYPGDIISLGDANFLLSYYNG